LEPLEIALQTPYMKTKDHPAWTGDFGFQLAQWSKNVTPSLCLYPSFFLQMKVGFEAFFEENGITKESQRAMVWHGE
jgi:hypothetical protein